MHSDGNDIMPLGLGGILKFNSNSMSGDTRCMMYTIVNDTNVEDDETFTVTLSVTNPNDQIGLPNTTTVLILDNDGMHFRLLTIALRFIGERRVLRVLNGSMKYITF